MTRHIPKKRPISPSEDNKRNVKKQKLDCLSRNNHVSKHERRRRSRKRETFTIRTRQENLAAIYDFVLSLREYLMGIGAFNAKGLNGGESVELGKFLDTTLVGVDNMEAGVQFLRTKLGEHIVELDPPHHELIAMVIENQFKKSRYPDHVLTYGFESTDYSNNSGTNTSKASFNPQVDALEGKTWQELRSITSPAVIYYLWSHVALFTALPNNGVLQITGSSSDKIAKAKAMAREPACIPKAAEQCVAMTRATKVALAKVSIVYANPFFFSAEKKVRYGLRPQRKCCLDLFRR